MEMVQIKKLDPEVINRIAAGEVIQRPSNALKELIENCLDAKSTNIEITVKTGGLKLLQIKDNGIGIRKEDFDIVCERFTTSKLRQFEDLHKISTYGFRGEALASISHIAHLTITSKTRNEICAYQATYLDSKLQGNLKPTAGNNGTIITVEDLFYNMTVRKKALRSPAEEYQKIAEVVSKYAIHNSHIAFALKKFGESNDIRTPHNSNSTDNIKIIYGISIARELIEFSLENQQFKFTANGYITNVNFSTKKMQFLLFINHRLVDCQSLKRAIDQVYSTYLPKNSHPFVYLSLELDPNNIDINVHPTKHEVHFMNEEQIINSIAISLESKLLGSNNSRAFFIQGKLPKMFNIEISEPLKDHKESTTKKSVVPQMLVRTDFNEQKLDKFFMDNKKPIQHEFKTLDDSVADNEYEKKHDLFLKDIEKLEGSENDITMNDDEIAVPLTENTKIKMSSDTLLKDINQVHVNAQIKTEVDLLENKLTSKNEQSSFISIVNRTNTKLTSILELRKEIEDNCHEVLRETIARHVFVGSITPSQALIQCNTKLYLCNTKQILAELLYQLMMYNFQNFGIYHFSNKISIYELAMIALDMPETGWTSDDGEKTDLAKRVTEILKEKGPMLHDYFSLIIDDDGNLCSIPILLDNYMPDPKALPMYILRLASEVNWKKEKECFESFARETVEFYSKIPINSNNESNKDWKFVVEHIIYPAIKEYFIPPKSFLENAAVLEIANLPNLYKVFERC